MTVAPLLAVVVSLTADFSSLPECRLDDSLAREVREAATFAIRLGPAGKASQAVVVNPRSKPPENRVVIEIVRDAPEGMTDQHGCVRPGDESSAGGEPDELSVLGVCVADVSAGRLRCSAEALSALIRSDSRAGRASPALLYVLAHELAHLRQRTKGTFEGPMAVVHLDFSERARWRELRQACREADATQVGLEERADAEALSILDKALDLPAYRERLLSPQASIFMAVERIRIAAQGLSEWEDKRRMISFPRPTALQVQTLDTGKENLERTSRRLLCQVLGGHRGLLRLPNVPGSHPDEPTRLSTLSGALKKKALARPVGRLGLPLELPRNAISQLDETLIPTVGLASASFDVQAKDFFARFWPYLCETYLNPERRPDCTDPSPGDGTPDCPLLLAVFDDVSLGAELADVPLQVEDGRLTVHGRVKAATATRGDALLLAVAQPRAVVSWSASEGARGFALPCEPSALTAAERGHVILCGDPFGYVSIENLRPTIFHRLRTALLNDQRLGPADFEPGWVGTVEGKTLASFYIASSGRSMGVGITKDGAISLPAWRAPGCEKLRSGLALFGARSPGEESIGVTTSPKATIEVARFDPKKGELRDISTPDLMTGREMAATLACGFAPFFRGAACVDTDGRLFDPFAGSISPFVGHVPLSTRFRRSPILWGSVCNDSSSAYLLAWDSEGAEAYALNESGGALRLTLTTERAAAWSLSCSDHGIVALSAGDERSVVFRVPSSSTGRSKQ